MRQVHLNLDDAWPIFADAADRTTDFADLDLRQWGPRLRYHGTRDDVEAFYRAIEPKLTSFVLYGSGDFHYLAAVFLRRLNTPVTIISFDNHPDWDVRPPHWSCGGWVNRALDLPQARRICVWGCGNFELAYPSFLFANRTALRAGRIEVHPWAERQSLSVQRRFDCMTRQNWRERFERFCESISAQDVYVTVDLDCLKEEEAVTNWENGLFTADDIAWALMKLRDKTQVVGGDLCGAYSQPRYARRFQRFAANWDHPRIGPPNQCEARTLNKFALAKIWPALAAQ